MDEKQTAITVAKQIKIGAVLLEKNATPKRVIIT